MPHSWARRSPTTIGPIADRRPLYRAGAWPHPIDWIALVVQLVVGNVVGADVVPDLFFGPVGKRRDFYHAAVVVIDFNFADI